MAATHGALEDEDGPLPPPLPPPPGRIVSEPVGSLAEEDLPPPLPPPGSRSREMLLRSTLAPLAREDLVAIGLEGSIDAVSLEKKIRAVQKELRRVQEIEERASKCLPLDAGQQALLLSKAQLQAQLEPLLNEWAMLEPVLIQRQVQRMAAIANAECAVCLVEYTRSRPAIRTSCCGYHFHRECLESCIAQNGHCPICFAKESVCKVVEQRSVLAPPSH